MFSAYVLMRPIAGDLKQVYAEHHSNIYEAKAQVDIAQAQPKAQVDIAQAQPKPLTTTSLADCMSTLMELGAAQFCGLSRGSLSNWTILSNSFQTTTL